MYVAQTKEEIIMHEALAKMIADHERIVFFGGAGVSTESGIPDFRSPDGLYSRKFAHPPEEMLSRTFFDRHTAEFYDFYRQVMLAPGAEPSRIHYKLAQLEQAGKLTAIVTQNIDGLHQSAGSKAVYELHGSVLRNFCMNCHSAYDVDFIKEAEGVPYCTKCGHIVKPDVVLYEEGLDNQVVAGAIEHIRQADVLIIAGTSLVVYPAAGLIDYFTGKHLVLINKEATARDGMATLLIRGSIGDALCEGGI